MWGFGFRWRSDTVKTDSTANDSDQTKMRLGEKKKIRGATPEQEKRDAKKLSVAAHLTGRLAARLGGVK
jgi:hypothetical protein